MGQITIPGPLAVLVLIIYAAFALSFLGCLVLALLASRDQARIRYEEKIGRIALELDVERYRQNQRETENERARKRMA